MIPHNEIKFALDDFNHVEAKAMLEDKLETLERKIQENLAKNNSQGISKTLDYLEKIIEAKRIYIGTIKETDYICETSVDDRTASICIQKLKTVISVTNIIAIKLYSTLMAQRHLNEKDFEKFNEILVDILHKEFNKDVENFEFLLDPLALGDFTNLFYSIFGHPGRHKIIADFIIHIEYVSSMNETHDATFKKFILCAGKRMVGPCFSAKEGDVIPKSLLIRSIYIPYNKKITGIEKHGKKMQQLEIPGPAIYTNDDDILNMKSFTAVDVNYDYFFLDEKNSKDYVNACTDDCCSSFMETGTYTDNELTICKKKPVISEMDSIWVPENIIVELIPAGKKGTSQAFLSGAKVRYSQSLFVIGPHYVDPLKKCGVKKWAKMIITRRKDEKTCDPKEPLHGRNYVRYCSGRAGSGLCLQAVTKDMDGKFLWKRTVLSRETNMVSTEGEDLSPPCKIKPRSYIIPVDKSIVICKEGYKKNGPYSSR
ncbi:uncharacterized protein LOC130626109 [Hydractinia symbiolongicarpus]|uniref:uncharacterized protein LOC130626109 n=1 Tax=Hydractinia symbiolongicarpus TaxID=13093 RepID=UPI00254EF8D6|nr:uncharacterized protein LOC130626109 [Hydractinia symbiolongicarpus]